MTRKIVQEAPPETVDTVYTYSVNPGNQFAQIVVSIIGQDIAETVAALTKRLTVEGIQVFHLDLPLDHPNALIAIPALEAQGFFWAAWMPEFSESGDVLRLQKTDAAVNPEEIICARENGERVKKHILEERQRVMKL